VWLIKPNISGGGGGGDEGARTKSYEDEKTRSSINYSILFGRVGTRETTAKMFGLFRYYSSTT
jgi:hypothetical protein